MNEGGASGASATECGAQFTGEHCEFARLEFLGNFPEFTRIQVVALSDDGTIVHGNASGTSGASLPFRWTHATGLEIFDDPGYVLRAATADGSIVVGSTSTSSALRALRWTNPEDFLNLGVPIGDTDATSTLAFGVSADGHVTVGDIIADSLPQRSFQWRATSGFSELDVPYETPDAELHANAISADGSTIVGTLQHEGAPRAFFWSIVRGTELMGPLPATALAANADGSVIVGAADFDGDTLMQAARWTAETGLVELELHVPCTESSAGAVTADGQVVAVTCYDHITSHAVLWDAEHGGRKLHDMLWERDIAVPFGFDLEEVSRLSADGQTIAGVGTGSDGIQQAWLLRLGDTP
jgi:uncharacterized membrane protein